MCRPPAINLPSPGTTESLATPNVASGCKDARATLHYAEPSHSVIITATCNIKNNECKLMSLLRNIALRGSQLRRVSHCAMPGASLSESEGVSALREHSASFDAILLRTIRLQGAFEPHLELPGGCLFSNVCRACHGPRSRNLSLVVLGACAIIATSELSAIGNLYMLRKASVVDNCTGCAGHLPSTYQAL